METGNESNKLGENSWFRMENGDESTFFKKSLPRPVLCRRVGGLALRILSGKCPGANIRKYLV